MKKGCDNGASGGMSDLERKILTVLESDFPLERRPYDILAAGLEMTGPGFLEKVNELTGRGLIRRIGAMMDHRKLGFIGTLAAVSVPPENVEKCAEVLRGFDEVTHCYLRKDPFNIWFTVIARNRRCVRRILERICSELQIDSARLLDAPMVRCFKLDARFGSRL
jgi:DNA-binding Lrp family transcriptional regulator